MVNPAKKLKNLLMKMEADGNKKSELGMLGLGFR